MSFAQRWKRASEGEDDFDAPDGDYLVTITGGRAWETNDGREFCKVLLRIDEGEHKGKAFADFCSLSTDGGMRAAKANCAVYGLAVDEIEDMDDLAIRIDELAGTRAEVTVVHNGGYLNVRAHRAMPANPAPEVPADTTGLGSGADGDFKPAPADDDDVPF